MPVPGQPMPPQGAAPQGAPAPQGGPSPAAQIVQTMMHGFQQLGGMVKQSGSDPQASQLLDQSQKMFEGWIQHMSQPAGHAPAPDAPQPGPRGPMPANANQGSKPAGF